MSHSRQYHSEINVKKKYTPILESEKKCASTSCFENEKQLIIHGTQ